MAGRALSWRSQFFGTGAMEQSADKSFVYGSSMLRRKRLFIAVAWHGHHGLSPIPGLAQRALFNRAFPVSIHFDVI